MKKYVYSFKEGNKEMKELLGGKGANLSEMKNIGLPVPDGFVVTTEACNKYYDDNQTINDEVIQQIFTKIEQLEKSSNKVFGDINNPLLVSVRSGSRASMPGMMDTVLNLGINDQVVIKMAEENERFAYDSYRRFIQMYADVVKGYPKESFEKYFDDYKTNKGIENDVDLTAIHLKEIVQKFKQAYFELAKEPFPQDPKEQLIESITAVFRSWQNDRAITYRRLNDIPSDWGTAVNVQEMVYGNNGETSGTGVAFSRNPATGEDELYGEYLINAQGEDVVAGIRTPENISHLKELMPEIYKEFETISKKLEHHYKDMQDMEFTIENGKLFILQTRSGKRTALASLKIAVDMVNEKLITENEALMLVNPKQLDQLLHPNFDQNELKNSKPIGNGLAASPGAAFGKIYFTAEDVVKAKENGEKDILLVRLETSPEDIEGMDIAKGILTLRGGMTSHAAVVARGMGRPCVTGCNNLVIDEKNKTLKTEDNKVYREGDYVSIDGTTGFVYENILKTVEPEMTEDFNLLMKWADKVKKMEVRANADTPEEVQKALEFGAVGIGLCRTEHMFFAEDRIFAIRQMIMAPTVEDRKKALEKILPMQQEDFEEMFRKLDGLPMTIRYLDPPLHEFLPQQEKEIAELAKSLNVTAEELTTRIRSLSEVNPMMGHRGLRLAVTYPEIAVMQTKAVINAALNVTKEGINVHPEIMIPLTVEKKEYLFVKKIVEEVADDLIIKSGLNVKYQIGTMIETPRATLLSDEIAEVADFYSYGTNDLTQLTFGFSRDDAGKFLDDYYKNSLLDSDPFARIDEKGVGQLLKKSVELAKKVKPNMSLGICGEHGGDPASVEFCHQLGLTYVSCSPFRVPIARLAAAQANLKSKKAD